MTGFFPNLYAPDGTHVVVPSAYTSTPEQVAAAVRMCERYAAVDVLPMLGVTE